MVDQERDQLILSFPAEGQRDALSLRLFEPIQVLRLEEESSLLRQGRVLLIHLAEDERFKEKLGPLSYPWIDFGSLLRILMGDEERLSVFLLLRPYGLEGLMPLREEEMRVMRRLSIRQRHVKVSELRYVVRERFGRIGRHLEGILRDHVHDRLGVVTRKDVEGKLEEVGRDRSETRAVFRVLEHLFGAFWGNVIREVEEGVYCLSEQAAHDYALVNSCAKGYFYHKKVSYPISHLVEMVRGEIARRWQGFPAGFVKRVLKVSPSYKVRRQNVRLACRLP